MSLAFMSFGFFEIMLIGVVALLVYGGDLPDVMRNLGRSYGKFRRALHDMGSPVREELDAVRRMPHEEPKTGSSTSTSDEEGHAGDDGANDEEAPKAGEGSAGFLGSGDDVPPPITSTPETAEVPKPKQVEEDFDEPPPV